MIPPADDACDVQTDGGELAENFRCSLLDLCSHMGRVHVRRTTRSVAIAAGSSTVCLPPPIVLARRYGYRTVGQAGSTTLSLASLTRSNSSIRGTSTSLPHREHRAKLARTHVPSFGAAQFSGTAPGGMGAVYILSDYLEGQDNYGRSSSVRARDTTCFRAAMQSIDRLSRTRA